MNESSYAVGWGALALINANIAQLKGKTGLFWFILSLILGPFATLVLAVQGHPASVATPAKADDNR